MKGFGLIVGACFLWAFDTLIRYPLVNGGMPSLNLVFVEHILLVALFFVPSLGFLKNLGKLSLYEILGFFVIGGLGSAMATYAFTEAFAYLNPSVVILLQKFQPIVAVCLATILLKESISRKFLFWGGLCILGGLMISHQDISGLKFDDFESSGVRGYVLVGLSVFGWGSSTVLGRWLSLKGHEPKQLMAGRFLFALLTLSILFAQFGSWKMPTLEVSGKIALMVGISGLLSLYLYYKGLKLVPAKLATLGEIFFPFAAVLVNWYFLDKTLTPTQIAGGGVLLVSSSIIQWKGY